MYNDSKEVIKEILHYNTEEPITVNNANEVLKKISKSKLDIFKLNYTEVRSANFIVLILINNSLISTNNYKEAEKLIYHILNQSENLSRKDINDSKSIFIMLKHDLYKCIQKKGNIFKEYKFLVNSNLIDEYHKNRILEIEYIFLKYFRYITFGISITIYLLAKFNLISINIYILFAIMGVSFLILFMMFLKPIFFVNLLRKMVGSG